MDPAGEISIKQPLRRTRVLNFALQPFSPSRLQVFFLCKLSFFAVEGVITFNLQHWHTHPGVEAVFNQRRDFFAVEGVITFNHIM